MAKIVIADFGTGNLHSVINAIETVAQKSRVVSTRSAAEIRTADRLVLPGQGAIGTWMNALEHDEVRAEVELALNNKPVMGICLGLQALYASSEEDGGTAGLDVLAGKVIRFKSHFMDAGRRIKIPHMGWSKVHQTQEHPMWADIVQDARFYFVHSYHAKTDNPSEIAATAEYGLEFVCAAAKENLFAVQFHPEKSRRQGIQLLENFVRWDGEN